MNKKYILKKLWYNPEKVLMCTKLTERERKLIGLRGEGVPLREVGKLLENKNIKKCTPFPPKMGVTTERVRQMQAIAVEKAKNEGIRVYEWDEINMIEFIASQKMLRIEQWRDKYHHWRVGIEWYGEEKYEFLCEYPTLRECLEKTVEFIKREIK